MYHNLKENMSIFGYMRIVFLHKMSTPAYTKYH